MTNNGGGKYVAIPDINFSSGIYQIEINCENTESVYAVAGFRIEKDYITYLQNINSTTMSIAGFNVTLMEINNNTGSNSSGIPMVMIGGTEYQSNEQGLVAVRLLKTSWGTQIFVTGATCEADIFYPDKTYFKENVSMTEQGDGIYYYNFTTPTTEGVYIYSVDCVDGSSVTVTAQNIVSDNLGNKIPDPYYKHFVCDPLPPVIVEAPRIVDRGPLDHL